MKASCTRCGTSLNAQGDAHDCDGRVVRVAFEELQRRAPGAVSLGDVATDADVPYSTVENWVLATPGLELKDGWITIIIKGPVAEPPPAVPNTEGISGMFLLIRIEELSRELGRRDVEVALLQAEIQKLRGES